MSKPVRKQRITSFALDGFAETEKTADTRKTINTRLKRLITIARELFFRFGIKRVSVEEICREANVSKMTFYKYFKNKDAIAIHILDEIYGNAFKKLDRIMVQDLPFDAKMRQIVTYKMELTNDLGKDFIREIMLDEDSECGKFLIQKRGESYQHARKIYTDARKRGDIRSDIKIDFIMVVVEYMGKVLLDKNVQDPYPDMAQSLKELFNLLFYGMLSRK
jgi:AcrR family transcriptional regulator